MVLDTKVVKRTVDESDFFSRLCMPLLGYNFVYYWKVLFSLGIQYVKQSPTCRRPENKKTKTSYCVTKKTPQFIAPSEKKKNRTLFVGK